MQSVGGKKTIAALNQQMVILCQSETHLCGRIGTTCGLRVQANAESGNALDDNTSFQERTVENTAKVLVTGAGGFIGHHLVSFLRAQGYWVRGVDLKPPEFCTSDANEFELLDLRKWQDCLRATAGIDEVYALAADMGGMGFISSNHAKIQHNNSLIDLHCIEA